MIEVLPISFLVTVPKGKLTDFTTVMPGVLGPDPDLVNDRWLTGFKLFPEKAVIGDTFFYELLGLGKFYDDLERYQMSEGIFPFNGFFVRPDEHFVFTLREPARIPAGAAMKFSYHSLGRDFDVKIYVTLIWERRT